MFDWNRFVKLGKILFDNSDEESMCTVISRFYYGIFGVVRRYLIRVKHKYSLARRDGDVHREVFDEIRNSKDNTLKEISNIFNKLRVARNHADYDDDFDKNYFKNFFQANEKELHIAFEALNYLKSNPNY